jgi:hypothetical protein
MRNQAFAVASSAVASAMLAACATSAPAAVEAAHAQDTDRFLNSIDFSAIEIAELFDFRTAGPIAAAADADPSYALPHETALDGAQLLRHASEKQQGYAHFAASELPDGWTQSEDAIRHRASGLECPLSLDLPEEQRSFPLVDVHKYDEKNLDVSCGYSDGSVSLTFYASFWPQMSLEDSAGGAISAIKMRFPVKAAMPVAVATPDEFDGRALPADLEEPVAAGFDIGEANGVPYKTSLWLVKTHGWHVKARATYAQQDVTTEIISAVMFTVSHLKVRTKNASEPITAGGEV